MNQLPTTRVLPVAPVTGRVTRLGVWLTSEQIIGAVVGAADPAARTGALLNLRMAWATDRFTLADTGRALERVLTELRLHGAAYERLLLKSVVTGPGVGERLQRTLSGHGLRADVRIISEPAQVQFNASARMRVRAAGMRGKEGPNSDRRTLKPKSARMRFLVRDGPSASRVFLLYARCV